MALQLGIQHHLVLIIAEHVRLSVLRYCAQLDRKRTPARLGIPVLHRVVITAAAVEKTSPTEDGAVGEIKPEVVPQVALPALPAGGRDLGRVGHLADGVRVL